MLIAGRLAKEHKMSQNTEEDFEEAVLQAQGQTFDSRECKTEDMDKSWRRQTVFSEEVEDEFWESYRLQEKSNIHLLYQLGDEDDADEHREAYLTSKTKIPGTRPVNAEDCRTKESRNFSQDKPSPSSFNYIPLNSNEPAEVKDPPIVDLNPPPLKEKSVRIPKV